MVGKSVAALCGAVALLLTACSPTREWGISASSLEFNGTRRSIEEFTIERETVQDPAGEMVMFAFYSAGQIIGSLRIQYRDKPSEWPLDGAPEGVGNAFVCVAYGVGPFSYGGRAGQLCQGGSDVLRALKLTRSGGASVDQVEIDWRGKLGGADLGPSVPAHLVFPTVRIKRL